MSDVISLTADWSMSNYQKKVNQARDFRAISCSLHDVNMYLLIVLGNQDAVVVFRGFELQFQNIIELKARVRTGQGKYGKSWNFLNSFLRSQSCGI